MQTDAAWKLLEEEMRGPKRTIGKPPRGAAGAGNARPESLQNTLRTWQAVLALARSVPLNYALSKPVPGGFSHSRVVSLKARKARIFNVGLWDSYQ